jgi:hypothetical protein
MSSGRQVQFDMPEDKGDSHCAESQDDDELVFVDPLDEETGDGRRFSGVLASMRRVAAMRRARPISGEISSSAHPYAQETPCPASGSVSSSNGAPLLVQTGPGDEAQPQKVVSLAGDSL